MYTNILPIKYKNAPNNKLKEIFSASKSRIKFTLPSSLVHPITNVTQWAHVRNVTMSKTMMDAPLTQINFLLFVENPCAFLFLARNVEKAQYTVVPDEMMTSKQIKEVIITPVEHSNMILGGW